MSKKSHSLQNCGTFKEKENGFLTSRHERLKFTAGLDGMCPFLRNKNGAVIHWIIFGIIGAIFLFLYNVSSFESSESEFGAWQLDMVNSFLYQSQVDLLELDLSAREAGWDAVHQLSSRGGFLEPSPCGTVGEVNQWNNGETWCLPDETENMNSLFSQLFPNPDAIIFSPLTIEGKRIKASGGKKVLKQTEPYLRQYTYDYGFDVNLQYSFDEYAQLAAEARKMVDTCREKEELEPCLNEVKPTHWLYSSCEEPAIPQGTRIWPFCVKSPEDIVIGGTMVRYTLALDFTKPQQ
ncbi:hypothetical protein HY496_01370 [Candidatus Woesearchaeota archaeon]|nr:hypothetical protein [Candidatus Woesearchaeota archaeon]